jgi:CDP-glucose 4,6-dehydratase
MSKAALRAPDSAAWRGVRVLVTGHTGFKGSWLSFWLARLGASVAGMALDPPTEPSNFCVSRVGQVLDADHRVDVRDHELVRRCLERVRPEAVFHLAAQSIVSTSFSQPRETWEVNVLGTVNLLEAVRDLGSACAVVVVTSDKCYERAEGGHRHTEGDRLGGTELYGATKAAAELAVASYRSSFFDPADLALHGVALATARAGNVIGGGDWAPGRIVPDAVRALAAGEPVPVRNPGHVRPFQHVLEPISGYLLLAEDLLGLLGSGSAEAPLAERRPAASPAELCSAFNFGPVEGDGAQVSSLVQWAIEAWGAGSWRHVPADGANREAPDLRLDSSRAAALLGWGPRWSCREAVERAVGWYLRFVADPDANMAAACEEDIAAYERHAGAAGNHGW